MYNRYIPDGAVYTRVPMEDDPPRRQEQKSPPSRQEFHERPASPSRPRSNQSPSGLLDGAQSSLNSLISSLGLEKLDSGDLLLFLILLLLLKEGDDLEMIIALGLTLLMGLGDDKEH